LKRQKINRRERRERREEIIGSATGENKLVGLGGKKNASSAVKMKK